MKMKTIIAMAATLSAFSAFAADEVPAQTTVVGTVVVVPQSVLDIHIKACPEYAEREADGWVQKESYTLPKSEYASKASTLYVLGCEMYAYNSLVKAYIVNDYETKIVSVAEVSSNGSIFATTDLMGAGFDAATNTLGTFSKGRGIGDCGQAATYGFDAREERFYLVEARIKDSCDGEIEAEWPIVYKK